MNDTERLNWFERHPDQLIIQLGKEGYEFAYQIPDTRPWQWSGFRKGLRECIDAAVLCQKEAREFPHQKL